MKAPDIFDLYTDYLITLFSYTTATGLSGLVDNAISHDPVTRFLSRVTSVNNISPHSFALLNNAIKSLSLIESLNY
jgi:hypothetical protein